MVENFKKGGAVINQLDRLAAAELKVELLEEGRATADFGEKAAMSEEQCVRAVRLGFETATKIECDLLCLGEMGIGNTASASALAAALSGGKRRGLGRQRDRGPGQNHAKKDRGP